MHKILFPILFIFGFTFSTIAQILIPVGEPIFCHDEQSQFGIDSHISEDGTRVSIGEDTYNNSPAINPPDKIYIFDFENGNWVANDTLQGQTPTESFENHCLSKDGKRILARIADDTTGIYGVRIYEELNGDWLPLGDDIVLDNILFGFKMAMSADGNRIVLDARIDNTLSVMKIFDFDGQNWVQQGDDISIPNEGIGQGIDMSADGNRIVSVSQFGSNAYVFDFINGVWQMSMPFDLPIAKVRMSDDGNTVAIVTVGGCGNQGQDPGSVKIFRYENQEWTQIGADFVGGFFEFLFGWNIDFSADGNRLILGIAADCVGLQQEVRIFDFNSNLNEWEVVISPFMLPFEPFGQLNGFGASVSLTPDGTRFCAGASENNTQAFRAGAMTVYDIVEHASTQNIVACESYTSPSGNHVWTMSGTYLDTLPTTMGYDSLIQIQLTIMTIEDVDISVDLDDETLVAQANNATFQWLDCDANFANIDGATDAIYTPEVNGNFAVAVTQNSCTAISDCFSIMIVGTDETANKLAAIKVFPNPTDGQLQIDFGKNVTDANVQIYNAVGQLVATHIADDISVFEIILPEKRGVYFLKIHRNMASSKWLKVIKN